MTETTKLTPREDRMLCAFGYDAPPQPIQISARLYEELKDYLAMETDMTAAQLLRRLRESAGNG
jgi:hypothetical protein